jgi:hypothetical protein
MCCGKMRLKSEIKEFGHCRDCKNILMKINKDCSGYLGIYIAEGILSSFFDGIERMPINNPGYDFLCRRGYKIDVKSSCLLKNNRGNRTRWQFNINRNQIADYFLCIGFDNRVDIEPQGVWLIPGELVKNRETLSIGSVRTKWSRFEKSLDKVLIECEKMRGGDSIGIRA